MNAGRPAYHGPINQPIWHNAGFRVTDAPVVYAGTVYAVGQPFGSGSGHAYAFDLTDGRRLWVSQSAASRIVAVAEHMVLTDDGHGLIRALDRSTGSVMPYRIPQSFAAATDSGGAVYVSGTKGSLADLDGTGKERWVDALPVKTAGAPVAAGRNVYVYGRHHVDELTPELYGVYAFDRTTGAPHWKREWRERLGKYRWDPAQHKMAWQEKPDKHTVGAVVADSDTAYVWELAQDERVFVTTTVLEAVDARSGRTVWQHVSSGACLDPPTLLDGDAILFCDGPRSREVQGSNYVALRRSNGAVVWRGTTAWNYERTIPYGKYAIASDRSVHDVLNENNQASPDSWLTLVDRQTGSELWRTALEPLMVFTLPAAEHGVVVVGSAPFTWNDPHVAGSAELAGLWAWRVEPR
jgi:outer membrane protein assembly factor BamB